MFDVIFVLVVLGFLALSLWYLALAGAARPRGQGASEGRARACGGRKSRLGVGPPSTGKPAMNARTLIRGCTFGALLVGCASAEPGAGPGLPASAASLWAKLTRTTLVIPQVDYEPAIFNKPDDPYPHIDFERVDRKKVVQKPHDAVVLENGLVRITVLPARASRGRTGCSRFREPAG